MTIKDLIDNAPLKEARQAKEYIRQWAYDCVFWERWAICDVLGQATHGEKCKLSSQLRKICLGARE